jgi:hypothetical protein
VLLQTSGYAHKLVAANLLLAESGWQLVEPDEEVEGVDGGVDDTHSASLPPSDKTPGVLTLFLLLCGLGLKCLVLFVVLKAALVLQAFVDSFQIDVVAPTAIVEEGEEVGREEGGEEQHVEEGEWVEEEHEVEEE